MAGISHLARNASICTALCLLSAVGAGETRFNNSPTLFLVCDKGTGSFKGKLPDSASSAGITVSVRATKRAGFAVRGCDARLDWDGGEILIASEVSQADVDVMGADLGFGFPVVAFQIKETDADPTIRYEIYSLNKPGKPLRTITGQDYFSAADTRLNGTVEIWTTDAAVANGFDNLPRRALDSAPTVVLRFQGEKLMDVSSEFRDHYDRRIAALRSQLDAHQLSEFKASDGSLSAEHLSPGGQMSSLLATKVKVLEIVWGYLYSGREQQAWDALDEMWPASDEDRVRTAIVNARTHGLLSQVDDVSHLTASPASSNSSAIYTHTVAFEYGVQADQAATLADTLPQQIVLRLPPPTDPQHWDEVRHLDLVIDEAGKIRSASLKGGSMKGASAGRRGEPDKEWIDDAAGWKYIPAFKGGRPIPFRCKLRVFRHR